MRRAAVGLALLAAVVASAAIVLAQPAAAPARIGMLPLGSPASEYDRSLVEAFRAGLRETALVENRDVVLDIAWVTGEAGAARAVAELVQRGAKLLVPCGTSSSLAAKRGAGPVPVRFLGAIFAFPPAARAGALVAYGPDYADLYRRAASYALRMLNGARLADLPVEQPAKFELVINLATARALNLSVPQALLLQASEVVR
jgi:hypothetical protein